MLKISLLFLLLCCWDSLGSPLSPQSQSKVVDYDGFKVFTVSIPKSKLSLLTKLKEQIKIDTWREPRLIQSPTSDFYTADLMVQKKDIEHALQFFLSNQLNYQVMVDDLGVLIKKEKIASELHRAGKSLKETIDWNDFYNSGDIYSWLDEIVSNNSDIATLTVYGQSTEGRDLKYVKISLPDADPNKQSIIIDGGIHAREWITPAVVTYIINDLLTNRQVNQDILEAYNIYLIPIFNIDGYEYTHTTDRMWRMTRRDHNDTENGCVGVDANRNFELDFGGIGSGGEKCYEDYRGPYAFSEPETAAFRDLILESDKNWRVHITLHNYGLQWFVPWGYTDELPPDYDESILYGQTGVDAIKALYGTEYDLGTGTQIGYPVSGCSDDWTKGIAGIKYTSTLELRGPFVSPPEEIIPTAEETWAGLKAATLFVSKRQ